MKEIIVWKEENLRESSISTSTSIFRSQKCGRSTGCWPIVKSTSSCRVLSITINLANNRKQKPVIKCWFQKKVNALTEGIRNLIPFWLFVWPSLFLYSICRCRNRYTSYSCCWYGGCKIYRCESEIQDCLKVIVCQNKARTLLVSRKKKCECTWNLRYWWIDWRLYSRASKINSWISFLLLFLPLKFTLHISFCRQIGGTYKIVIGLYFLG